MIKKGYLEVYEHGRLAPAGDEDSADLVEASSPRPTCHLRVLSWEKISAPHVHHITSNAGGGGGGWFRLNSAAE